MTQKIFSRENFREIVQAKFLEFLVLLNFSKENSILENIFTTENSGISPWKVILWFFLKNNTFGTKISKKRLILNSIEKFFSTKFSDVFPSTIFLKFSFKNILKRKLKKNFQEKISEYFSENFPYFGTVNIFKRKL